jgi:hypothetical protein
MLCCATSSSLHFCVLSIACCCSAIFLWFAAAFHLVLASKSMLSVQLAAARMLPIHHRQQIMLGDLLIWPPAFTSKCDCGAEIATSSSLFVILHACTVPFPFT